MPTPVERKILLESDNDLLINDISDDLEITVPGDTLVRDTAKLLFKTMLNILYPDLTVNKYLVFLCPETNKFVALVRINGEVSFYEADTAEEITILVNESMKNI